MRTPPLVARSALVVVALGVASAATFGPGAEAAPGPSSVDLQRVERAREALSADPVASLASFHTALALAAHARDPSARDAVIDQVARAAASPITRDHAKAMLAERKARQGRFDEARRLFDEIGLVEGAWVLGPFENTGGALFSEPMPGEDLAGGVERKHDGLARQVSWQRAEREPRSGAIDLMSRLQPVKDTRALLAVVVTSARAQPAALRLGTSGQAAVVLNGVEVAKLDVDRPLALDQDVVPVRLEKGENLLLVRLGHLDQGSYAAFLRLTAPDGGRLQGVATTTQPAALARAAKVKGRAEAPVAVVDPVALARARAQANDADAAALSRVVELERALRPSDVRARPTSLEVLLSRLVVAHERSPAKKPELARALAALGRELLGRDPSRARAALERALVEDPACVDAMLALAELRSEQGLVHEARALYAKARAAFPGSPLVATAALSFARREGALGIATDGQLLQAAREVPVDHGLRAAADVARERGDVAEAARLLDPLRARDEAASDVLSLEIARIEARLADPAADVEAETAKLLALLKKKLRHYPGSHATAEDLALALFGAGKKAEAKALADERRRLYPERPEPRTLQADLALLEGDRDAARAALESALALVPQDARIARALRAFGEGAVDELTARYGIDPAIVQDDPVPEGAREVGAHVAAHTIAVRFFENGLSRTMTDRLLRVHDAKRVDGLRAFPIPYVPGREQVEVLVAERITKDGRREAARDVVDRSPGGKQGGVYTDVHTRVVVFGELQDGDLVHVRYRKDGVGQQNLFGDFFGAIEPIQDVVPVRRWRMVVEAPLSRKLSWGGRGVPQPTIEEKDGVRVHDFKVDEAPRLVPEPGMPPFYEVARYLSVSTYGSWQDLGAWYARLVAPQLELDDDLRAVARDLKARAKSEEELVRLVYEWVITKTRYVGIELGIHGWKPYKVTEVHRRGFGDCKDKASMLVALLHEVGVPARIALVRTANAGRIEDAPASMWHFNHAIAYVPSLDLFLDGTAETSGWRELPPMDQGALTLIVAPRGSKEQSRLTTIPVKGPEASLNVSDYVLTLARDGTLAVRGKESFRGDHNAEQRVELNDPATRARRLERQLSSIMPGAQVHAMDVSDLSLSAEEISYRFEATLPNRAVRDAGGAMTMPLSLYPHDLSGNYAQQSRRSQDVWLTRPWRTRNVMRYVLPKGARVVDLPQGGVVESKHVRFVQKVTRTDDGFIVDEDTSILSRRIPVEDYAAFREAALKADALMKRKVRLVVPEGAGS